MSIYVVTAYRWGQRNAHSYVVGAFTNKTAAIECAEAYVDYRGGKYGCEVVNAPEWTEDADNVAEQVYYAESPYFGKASDAGHFHAADIEKRCVPSQKPFTVRELQNKIDELERENAELRKDKERLDLLASRYWAVPVTKEYTDHIWMIDHDTPDLRAAIDARAKEANQ